MKQISTITTLLLMFMVSYSFAQITVTGQITSVEDGLGVIGANVILQGTLMGTAADFDGNYSIEVPDESAVLEFSFIGLQTQEITVGTQRVIDVILLADAELIEEVVVIGYGTVKKSDVTGSVSVIDSRTIDELKPIKVEEALQGTMAGVNVTQQSGAPGAGLDIRIRGVGTNGATSPTVIIDGYEGDLSILNPADIKSIVVLKDAQAAIYGTRGANGVILVTTNQGTRNSPLKIGLNSSYGIQEATRKIPLLNATEYAVLLNESYAASGQPLPFTDISGLGQGTDWQDQLFSQEPIFSNDINFSKGSENMSFALSASNIDQSGIIGDDKSGFKRSTARISLGADLTSWLKLNTSVAYTHINRKSVNEFGLGSVLFNALNMPATVPVFDSNGDYFLAPSNLGIEIINPLAQIANTYNDYDLHKLNGNIGLESSITPKLKVTTRIGFNKATTVGRSFSKIVDYGGKVFDISRSSVSQDKDNFNDYTFDAFLTYATSISDRHNFSATVGTTAFREWGNTLSASGFDIPNNSWDFADLSLANGVSEQKPNGSSIWDQRTLSYFSRLQFDYDGKYLASAMLRRDASTKFGPDNRVAYFPSLTLGWIVSKENFFNSNKIEQLKLRASYGLLGSDRIQNFLYNSLLSGEATYVLDGQLVNGRATGILPNTNVKWEQAEKLDIGLDVSLFNNRVNITADYYNETRKDLLIPFIPVSGILGTSAPGSNNPTINAGTVVNNGFEFAVGVKGGRASKFGYSINYNITTINNEVTKVDNGTGFYGGGGFGVGQPLPARMEEGFPLGYFYGYQMDGIFQNQAEVEAHPSQQALGAMAAPGDIRFKDVNGDGILNEDDRTNLGDAIPDFTMGLNISLNAKAFDFVVYAFSSIGNDIVRNYERVQPNVNRTRQSLERWTGEGTSTTVPRLTNAATTNTIFSDYYVEDGSFLRLQKLQLGYTLPKAIARKIKTEKLRLYVSVNNLLTLTKYSGYDPVSLRGPNNEEGEPATSPLGIGFDYGVYPVPRTYIVGLNLNF